MNPRLFLLISYIITLMLLTLLGYLGDLSSESYNLATEYFSASEIKTGKQFFRFALIPWTIYRILIIVILFFLINSKKYLGFVKGINQKIKNSFLRLLITILFFTFFLNLLKIPFSIIAGFMRDRYFQVTGIDFLTWLTRHSASAIISIGIFSISIALILFIINRTRRYLITVPLVFIIIGLALSVVYPRVVTPLFYETSGVHDPALKGKITKLLHRAGVKEVDVHLVYKSRYRMTANAYFTGTGSRREIYLYDTLLKKFTHDEILSILAHELIHYNEEHVLLGIFMGGIGLLLFIPLLNFAAFRLFGRDIRWLTLPERFPALLFSLTILLYFIKPVNNAISRVMERRADIKSFELIENRDVFTRMEEKLAVVNRSNILPNPLYTFFYYTHPPVLERIKTAKNSAKLNPE